MLSPEFVNLLRAYTRVIYYVTPEEDVFLRDFHEMMVKHEARTWVFVGTNGLMPIAKLRNDWSTRAHHVESPNNIHDALIRMYQDSSVDDELFYIITDPDRWLKDDHVVRRILNIVHQLHQEPTNVKSLIFVGPRLVIPEKLQPYVNVVHDPGMTSVEINELVARVATLLKTPTPKGDVSKDYRGLNRYQVEEATFLSVAMTRKENRRVDLGIIQKYRRGQLQKTGLLQYVNHDVTFDQIGGADRFKTWAKQTAACWTPEGQAFGLSPPRGVLLVGVYGCGKSICAKALAKEWDLPLVQFEMGRLRSSGVGDSENNLYRALSLVESAAPCIMWVDEAEKSLSGGESSAQSDAGTTSRLLGILSTWAQESKAPVCIVLTANSLDTLPVEMVNRMPQRFFFDLPNEENRIDILKIHAKKAGQDVSSFNLVDLAEKAKNLVGREIEQAITEAMVRSFHAKKKGLDETLLGEVLTRKPRIIRTMTDEINRVLVWVGYDPDADDGIRAHLASSNRSEQFLSITAG